MHYDRPIKTQNEALSAGLKCILTFFEQFPYDYLRAFAIFGSQTIRFRLSTTSLPVLFSERRTAASLNAFLYVFFMFCVIGILECLVSHSGLLGSDHGIV